VKRRTGKCKLEGEKGRQKIIEKRGGLGKKREEEKKEKGGEKKIRERAKIENMRGEGGKVRGGGGKDGHAQSQGDNL
jgi:hypothetical protein